MKKLLFPLLLILVLPVSLGLYHNPTQPLTESEVVSHTVDLKIQNLKLYWKNADGANYGSFAQLKTQLAQQQQELVFAMNGGMYQRDLKPQGLFIENRETKRAINQVQEAYGNFYMQPNGVFYLTDSKEGFVCTSIDFKDGPTITYATQSGPMLVIDGQLHPRFMEGSKNVHIRNGVGVLPDGQLLFVLSKEKVNFYDFATYFKNRGCKNALYLDGFVSRTYLPAKNWEQLDGQFGVIIGETKAM